MGTDENDLSGLSILVVEDDYFLGNDAARTLRDAGAEIIGPIATEDEAFSALAARRPDAALVDINLGAGPSFKLAETLKKRGIPFVFVTGYDREAIPAAFCEIVRLESRSR